jgi:hypothetical protein
VTRRDDLLLFLLGIGLALAAAAWQAWPGYMDADYYYAAGRQLAAGQGFQEPFLWNYLGDPAGLPQPAFTYWMPLAGLLAALGMFAGGSTGFGAARAGFLLLAGLLPPLTARLGYSLTEKRGLALLSGLLAAFSGFYWPYLSTTDTFGIYMILGTMWLQVASGRLKVGNRKIAISNFQRSTCNVQPFILGLISGLMHLARADGLLWLGLGLIWLQFEGCRSKVRDAQASTRNLQPATFNFDLYHLQRAVFLLAGYLLVMSPWFFRNLLAFGTLLSPGGGRALWLTAYDELYLFPAAALTPARWWATGPGALLAGRLWALGQNLQTALAVQGEIFLVPLTLLGAWRHRADRRVRLGLLAWCLTFLTLTAAFPFQSARGGLFHSGAALQPLFWALAPAGLELFVAWGERRRGWRRPQAFTAFAAGLVLLAALLTGLAAAPKLLAAGSTGPAWGESEAAYVRLERSLQSAGLAGGEAVLVNNPPGYWVASGRRAAAIPAGDEAASLAAARRYGAGYILLEGNHPAGLAPLYRDPGDRPGLDYLFTFEGTHVFRIDH